MNRFALIMMIGLVSVFAGCEEVEIVEEKKPAAVLTLDKDEFEVTSFGGQCQVTVTANYDYEVVIPDDCAEWVRYKVSGTESDVVSFIISANADYEDRVVEIEIRLPEHNLSKVVKIVQKQKNVMLLDNTEIDVSFENGTFSVKLSTNVDYEINISDSWVKRAQTKAFIEEDIVFEVEENTSFDIRTADIKFKSDSELKTLKVIQKPQINNFVLKVTHDLDQFNAPVIIGKIFSSNIFWGDGMEEVYSEGAKHNYFETDTKVVEISFEGPLNGHEVTFNDIVGIKEIDLSGM